MNLDGVFVELNEDLMPLQSAHGSPSLEALGSYNTLDFVVRLRPDLHNILEAYGGELAMRDCGSWEAAQAFSTYLHETIHWWQHSGTTIGIILSFLQPAHAHLNRKGLEEVLVKHGPVKPLLSLAEKLANDSGSQDGSLNAVLNNWHDLEFFRKLIINPTELASDVVNHPYFMSVGHSYHMAIASTSWLIGATLDADYEVLPHPLDWEPVMDELNTNRVNGFYRGSSVEIPPLGAREIFEGQARFSQLQYLYGASSGHLTWDDIRRKGLLRGLYGRAFEIFLDYTAEEWPSTVDHPIVGLFLLICDVALSPAEGLFLPMTDPSALIWSTDPGWRFVFLCSCAKSAGSDFKRTIQTYSADEYWAVSQKLSDMILSPSPRQLAEAIVQYSNEHPAWRMLQEEDRTFNYRDANFPIRVLIGRFTKIQRDKLLAPQFFCWPGMCMTSFRPPLESQSVESLFKEHAALFVNRAEMDVYPRAVPGKDEATLQRLLDDFYTWVSAYEMTRQWLVDEGPFEYDYNWLTSKFSNSQIKEWADRNFTLSTGVEPDRFIILKNKK